MSRKEQLQAMLADDPDDTFLQYGLAMELRKSQEYKEAKKLFDQLINHTPPYIPAYFMCGQMLVEQSDINQARTYLRTGIDEARSQGDMHAAGEMSELLTTLGSYGE